MKKITRARIVRAVGKQCGGSYYMSLVGQERKWVIKAVNQGIDAHLQACNVPARGDSYAAAGGRLECHVSGESLAVLLRRLTEMDHAETDDGDSPETLATDILTSLDFDVESMEYEIDTDE